VVRKPFDPDVVAATPYDIWHFQDVLFVIDSFDQLGEAFEDWVARKIGK
jgi:phenylalanine-4-hydroxylase